MKLEELRFGPCQMLPEDEMSVIVSEVTNVVAMPMAEF